MHLQVLIPVDEFAPCPGRAKVTGEPSLKILTFRHISPEGGEIQVWGRREQVCRSGKM